MLKDTFLLRLGVAVVMAMHSVPSIVSGDIISFGNEYLAKNGFGFMGLPLAFMVKGIHLFSVFSLLFNKFIKPIAILNSIILILGIVMIHASEGWYVVGGGRNGVEFNFILITIFLSFLLPDGMFKKSNESAL
ncbi:DoxX family protein [Flavobacterium sp. H122]|uniref:DoxX family protein n=1 Tax=Flavobacterium sp. H122 TaxID=2529860 RepID=UPI0020BF6A4E|nr:DoxX family protein [Flavobacterium sp. H122]